MIHRENDGVQWLLQPEFAPLLEKLLQTPGRTVKESPVKQVSLHDLAGRTFYIKRYRHRAVPLRPLKYLLVRTQAREEWDVAQQLEARGLPIVRHVALGERRAWSGVQESLLITEGFPGVPLDQIEEVDPAAVRRFVENLHRHGVLQEDLHPGNVLVRKEPFELRLVDLHGTRIRPSLSDAERDRNLALLRVSFPIPVSPEVHHQSRQLRRVLLSARSRRCLRRNRDFGPIRSGGLRWQVRHDSLTDPIRTVLAGPDGFLQSRARILKRGRTSTVGSGAGVVLKRYNFRKLQNLVKDLFRRSRARRAFRAAYHLELTGVATARAIAVASQRFAGILLRSYLVMEEIPGAVDLGTRLRDGSPPPAALVRQIATLIARLHEEGFSHRDLKETNLVFDSSGKLSLIDLDGLKFLGELPSRRAAADLARLNRGMDAFSAVRTEHRRMFLRTYCRLRRLRKVPRTEFA